VITMVERIRPEAARDDLQLSDALLVCAYGDGAKFEKNVIPGAISLDEFHGKEALIPKDREVIFYCACPHEASATHAAEEAKVKGFVHAKVVAGGFNAMQAAGFDTDFTGT